MGGANLVKVDEIIRLSISPRHMFFSIQVLLPCMTAIATRKRICNPLEWDTIALMMEFLDKIESYIASRDEENISNFYERKIGEFLECSVSHTVNFDNLVYSNLNSIFNTLNLIMM